MNISEILLEKFKDIAKIPRQSCHEEKISEYLVDFGKKLGLKTIKDKYNNVIIEKPATKGNENAPKTILQAHMDMVCVAKDGVKFNPLTDPIKLIIEDNILKADGTSLGADDGFGLVIIMKILEDSNLNHGPIKAIFTAAEEVGCIGAEKLDPKYLIDSKYLISMDHSEFDVVLIGSAGISCVKSKINTIFEKTCHDLAYKIDIKGVKSGHSGLEIHKFLSNAIVLLGNILYKISDNIDISLASINGGEAFNAIPTASSSIITLKKQNRDEFFEIINKYIDFIILNYKRTNPNLDIIIKETDLPDKVFSKSDKTKIINYLLLFPQGAYTANNLTNNLVESSANLGIIKTNNNDVLIEYSLRYANEINKNFILNNVKSLSSVLNVKINIETEISYWIPNEGMDRRLIDIYCNSFKSLYLNPEVKFIHAGQECGILYNKNPNLDVICVGVDNPNVHTADEKLYIDTLGKLYDVVVKTLNDLSNI